MFFKTILFTKHGEIMSDLNGNIDNKELFKLLAMKISGNIEDAEKGLIAIFKETKENSIIGVKQKVEREKAKNQIKERPDSLSDHEFYYLATQVFFSDAHEYIYGIIFEIESSIILLSQQLKDDYKKEIDKILAFQSSGAGALEIQKEYSAVIVDSYARAIKDSRICLEAIKAGIDSVEKDISSNTRKGLLVIIQKKIERYSKDVDALIGIRDFVRSKIKSRH